MKLQVSALLFLSATASATHSHQTKTIKDDTRVSFMEMASEELDDPTRFTETSSEQLQKEEDLKSFFEESFAEADRITSSDDPLYTKHAIPGQYIIVFEDSVSDVAAKAKHLSSFYGGADRILWIYTAAFKGVALNEVDDELLETLSADPDVKYIEQDVTITLDEWDGSTHVFEQHLPPNWGLDRIDKIVGGTAVDGMYRFQETGEAVTVYVVDSGIRWDHEDFEGREGWPRVGCGSDSFRMHPEWKAVPVEPCHDGVGHGTHVASVIGGNAYGVAKDVNIVSVKVFDNAGQGSVGSAMHGIDFVQNAKALNPDSPMIANFSFGTPVHLQSFEDSLSSLIEQGVIVTASAGNARDNACRQFPASHERVISVGASTFDDAVAPYSNFGPCVDIFAPGDRITGAWMRTYYDEATVSGTSSAAAHAAGVVALALELFPDMNPEDMRYNVIKNGELDALSGVSDETGTPNLLVSIVGLLVA